MSQPNIIVATSIAPFEIEKQQLAVQTWLELGFSVISLNIRDEINQLQSSFEGVKFHEVKRDARKQYGKPLVYVNDLLKYLQGCEAEVCGIVNSDIHLRADKDFVSYIYRQTKGSTLFASRIDIDSIESVGGELYGYGFDMFFFDRDLLHHFPDCDTFCLGIPWWDYWLPCIALKKELNPKYLQDTVAYHVQHPINYSLQNWREVGITFTEFFNPEMAPVLQNLLETEQIEDFDRQLGPNITYNFILEFYQSAELLNYRKLTLESQNLSNMENELEIKSEPSVHSMLSGSSDLEVNSADRNSGELGRAPYDSCVRLAWEHYCEFRYDRMIQDLKKSLNYTSNQPKAQVIANWIEQFTNLAEQENYPFDAYLISNTPEWQNLMNLTLLQRVEKKLT